MARRGMDEVELVEDDWIPGGEPAPVPHPARAPVPWRVLTRRWWPLPVVLAAVLVLADLGTGSVEERDFQRVQALPGVIRPIGPQVRMTEPNLRLSTLDPGELIAGVLVNRFWGATGSSIYLVGTDPRTGDRLWRTDLPLGSAGPGEFAQAECWDDRDELVCWGSIAHQDPDTWSLVWGRSTLVHLDPATGEVRSTQPLAAGTAATGQDDLLITATDQDGVAIVTAARPGGTPLWTAQGEPADVGDLTASDRLSVATGAEHVAVSSPAGAWLLDRTDGRLVAQGSQVLPTRAGGFWLQRFGRLWLVDDTGQEVDLGTGQVLTLGVDDGSAPDTEFISLEHAQELRAVDARTGDELWATEQLGWQPHSSLLIGGTLYGSSSAAVHAVDARTGAPVWDADVVAYNTWSSQPVTDGRQLLMLAREDGAPALVALDLRTGERLWSAPMPEDAELLTVQRHQLFLLRPDRLTALS